MLATYNGAPHVGEQVTTILRQSRAADEIVVVDDGSDDGTVETVKALLSNAEVPGQIVVNPERLGPAANFGGGIQRARGDVIVLCDQDDRWSIGKLETLAQTFSDSSVVAAFSDGRTIDASGRPLGRTLWEAAGFTPTWRRRWETDGGFAVLLRGNVVTGATLAFRRALTDRILPLPALAWHDHWIALIACTIGSVAPIPDLLIDYRIHGSNTMGLPPAGFVHQAAARLRADDLRSAEIGRLAQLRNRLSQIGARPSFVGQVEEKIRHLQFRADLPKQRMRRVVPVVQEAVSGRYHRLGAGWRSIGVDLIQPRSAPAD